MNAKADGGLRQRLINPISIRLSAIAKDKAPEPVFSVAAALKDPRRILIITHTSADWRLVQVYRRTGCDGANGSGGGSIGGCASNATPPASISLVGAVE